MSNLEKSVNINLENTAHYENISNLDITFRTGESDSSVLLFNIIKNNQPLFLSKENIKARIAIRGKGVMVVAPLEILDPFKGALKFQLPNDVIKRDGNYQAQVSVAELGNSDVVVVERTISFNVEKSLFSMIPSETKLHYIVEFQELEKTIMDRAKAMDEAIKNGEDYASLIEKAKEKGLSDIQIAKSSSIEELKQLANSRITDLENKAQSYSRTFDEQKRYMDEKHEDFKQSVNSGGLVTSGATSNWQKSKITKDDGRITQVTRFDFNNPEQKIGDSTQFIYVSQAINYPVGVSTDGTVEYLVMNSDCKRMTYRPNGTNRVFVKRKEDDLWSDWSELAINDYNNPFETVQNAQSKASVAESNAKLYADDKFNKRYSVIFEGTANGVGSTIYLNESLDQFIVLIFYGTFPGGEFIEIGNPFGDRRISITPSNVIDSDGNGGAIYEFGLTKTSRTSLTISNDVYFDLSSQRGSGANANRGTINKIIGVKK
ncbi:BppU family phage baseplate upper protein [Staphylococcus coagulans]|uniref:phage baseplate upper protein n=1 Tax=Staphylococcus TaxID=1279 RepID=UPI001BE686B8|nr:phage baseplate upper protein [Staphylococcus schleiferi]MBT2860952.1 BppU family phage baseplate upper protein [Staphylococcus coagulans]HDK5702846.1 phage baseplate upper protein [Staphylococcus pseudintermedius]MBU3873231.1 phage baseplate upper protein [Staphylococcus coagulans]UXR54328.1 BppU family phage baseplate upper protein [Staphylococcus schleiferi]UXR61233.1 BppU family phage baseplate upper protein [Staphylococcus schleiferi]